MDVNINNLRIRLGKKTDLLIKTLNGNITDEGELAMHADILTNLINNIREDVWVLCCVFDKNQGDDFREVWEDVGEIAVFNPRNDE